MVSKSVLAKAKELFVSRHKEVSISIPACTDGIELANTILEFAKEHKVEAASIDFVRCNYDESVISSIEVTAYLDKSEEELLADIKAKQDIIDESQRQRKHLYETLKAEFGEQI